MMRPERDRSAGTNPRVGNAIPKTIRIREHRKRFPLRCTHPEQARLRTPARDIMGSTLLYVIAGMALLAQSQQPPVFLSFFARVASFFNSGRSAKHASRQSRTSAVER
jgi:hypothetical protein